MEAGEFRLSIPAGDSDDKSATPEKRRRRKRPKRNSPGMRPLRAAEPTGTLNGRNEVKSR